MKRAVGEAPWMRRSLIAIAVGFFILFMIVPLGVVFATVLPPSSRSAKRRSVT